MVEAGFHTFPEGVAYTFANVAGSLTAGLHNYMFVWKWLDRKGNVHRSSPSPLLSTTDSTGNLISSDRILISGDLIKAPYVILEKIDNVDSEYKEGQLDIRIAINGDVVSDGEIKIGDVAKLYRHFRGRDVMTDEVLLAAGDVIADGEIKIGDVAQLYRYFRGRISNL